MADRINVKVIGLRELRKDMRAIGNGANREVSKEIKQGLMGVAAEARREAPRQSGALAGSIRPFAVGAKAGLVSRLPYANVQHWGGTIYPRGAAVAIPRTEFLTRAIVPYADELVDELGDALERFAGRHGW